MHWRGDKFIEYNARGIIEEGGCEEELEMVAFYSPHKEQKDMMIINPLDFI